MPFHRGLRDAEHLGGFGDGHANKVAQLDQLSFDVVVDGKLVESAMHSQKLILVIRTGKIRSFNIQSLEISAVTQCTLMAGLVDQDAAHRLCGGSKEMSPPFPLIPMAADQAQPGFVNQRSRLERLPGGLIGQLGGRQFPQFLIHQGKQFVSGLGVALLCGSEDLNRVADE